MGFSLVLHGQVPRDEICGVVVGHGELLALSKFSLFLSGMGFDGENECPKDGSVVLVILT